MKFVIGLLIGLFMGWVWAHMTVATECRRLGSFYVGKTTFHCTATEERK